MQALPPAGQTVAQVAVPLTAVVAAGVVSVNKVTRAVDEKTSAVKKSVDEKKAAVKKSVEESPLGAAKLKVRRPCPRLSAPRAHTHCQALVTCTCIVYLFCRACAMHAYHKVSDALESVRKAAAGLGES